MDAFPATADDFYLRRDHRTNAYGHVDVRYVRRTVRVTADARALTSFAGQVLFLITCNILARWCRCVVITVDDAPLHARFRASNSIVRHALDVMFDADPFGQFTAVSGGDADLHVHIGEDCPKLQARTTVLTCAGWRAGVRRFGEPGLPMRDSDNPVGAAHAAVLGGAQVFRDALERGELYPSGFVFDGFTATPVATHTVCDESFPRGVSIGKALMAGAGSVGSAALFFADLFDVQGAVDLVDADWVKIENFARSPVFGRRSFGRRKVDVLAERLSSGSLNIVPVPAWWHEAGLSPTLAGYDLVLPLANEHGIRWALQNLVPPLMVHASTGRNWNVNVGRHIPGRDDCLVDRFEGFHDKSTFSCAEGKVEVTEETSIDASLPFLSFFSGLLVATDLVRLGLPMYPHTPNFAHYSFRANRFEPQFDSRGPRQGCICTGQGDLFWTLRGNTRHAWLSAPARH